MERFSTVFLRNLGFRIALTVALSIFALEGIIGFYNGVRQKQNLKEQKLEYLDLVVQSLQEEFARQIQKENFENLSETVSSLSRQFQVSTLSLFDKKGKILVRSQYQEGYESRLEDLKQRLVWSQTRKKCWEETWKTPKGEMLRYLSPVQDSEGKVVGGINVEIPLSQLESQVEFSALQTAGLATLISLAIMLVLMPLLRVFVVNPIHSITTELMDFSKGEADLTFRIKVRSHDEIGDMAEWFNTFLEKIRTMVSRVLEHSQHLSEQVRDLIHSTGEVSAMSEDVSTTISQIARGAEEQASKISEVHHLMQDMQETMKDVEKRVAETSSAVDQATSTAQAGGKLARGTIERMAALNETILKNSELIHHLGQKSREIGRVVEIIQGISEQTNLLSLNAAIEAARAGEHGKGFAVVAEEIRILSDRVAKATNEIGGVVQLIQDETLSAVESMEKSAREAQVSQEGIRKMERSLDEINEVIENVAHYSKSISDLVALQNQRYDKIVNSIQDINAVSEESAASTEEVSASTQEQTANMEQINATFKEISAMAEELKMMVEKFKIR